MSSYKTKFPIMEEYYQQRAEADRYYQKFQEEHLEAGLRYWPSQSRIKVHKKDHVSGQMNEIVYGTCLRRSYYACIGEPITEEVGDRVRETHDYGNIVEEVVAQRLSDLQGYQRIFPNINGKKLRFKNKGVSGEADLVMRHIETDTLIGIDIKTYDGFWACKELHGYQVAKSFYKSASPFIRKYLDKARKHPNPEFTAPGKPKEDNVLQCMLYLHEFKSSDIKIWKLIYIGRDKAPTAEFDIELEKIKDKHYAKVNGEVWKDFTVEGIYQSFSELAIAHKREEAPARDYEPEYDSDKLLKDPSTPNWMKEKIKAGETIRHWRCQFCPFLKKCLEDRDNELFV